MEIAVATNDNWTQVSGHAGQTRDWLVFDCQPGAPLPEPRRVLLTQERQWTTPGNDVRSLKLVTRLLSL